MKWVENLPQAATRGPKSKNAELLASLRSNPGQWAEIARYPAAKKSSAATARSRGDRLRKGQPDIEVAVRTVDNHRVLFVRSTGV